MRKTSGIVLLLVLICQTVQAQRQSQVSESFRREWKRLAEMQARARTKFQSGTNDIWCKGYTSRLDINLDGIQEDVSLTFMRAYEEDPLAQIVFVIWRQEKKRGWYLLSKIVYGPGTGIIRLDVLADYPGEEVISWESEATYSLADWVPFDELVFTVWGWDTKSKRYDPVWRYTTKKKYQLGASQEPQEEFLNVWLRLDELRRQYALHLAKPNYFDQPEKAVEWYCAIHQYSLANHYITVPYYSSPMLLPEFQGRSSRFVIKKKTITPSVVSCELVAFYGEDMGDVESQLFLCVRKKNGNWEVVNSEGVITFSRVKKMRLPKARLYDAYWEIIN